MAVVEHPEIDSVKRKALYATRAMPHQSVIRIPALCSDGLTGRELPAGLGPHCRHSLLDLLSTLMLTLDFVSEVSTFRHLASLA